MGSRVLGLIVVLASVAPAAIAEAPAASADCTNAGGAYVCAQGDVRGGGPTPPQAGPLVPYPCGDWYCNGGLQIVLDPGRPNRPGGGRPGGPR